MTRITRRRALGVAASAAAGLAAGRALTAPAQASAAPAHRGTASEEFDEIYLGRRIQGAASHGGGHHGDHGGGYAVRIDGRELHVMRNADGTWISVINHYEPLATPRAVARAAVRELQGALLVPVVTA
ncbi:apotyrosinase chaperone MelC1 [Streptomyces sp. NPDC000229]|uniref:apotyrosinase chaperone MelC1 n=1 Tax=Streptomyces sp. NPDC000229 TaxID=3154247 RepID=UPI00331CAE82